MPRPPEVLEPDWRLPGVRALVTTRAIGDMKDPEALGRLQRLLPAPPVWLKQVHGATVVEAAAVPPGARPEADASFTTVPGVVCTVMAADCMPVLIAAVDGSVVGAAHAGWRGLCSGVIERTVESMREKMRLPSQELRAYLGPAIGARVYEVGNEVRDAFVARDPACATAFAVTRPGHWLLDLYAVARQRLSRSGITIIHGATHCTYSEPDLFFSFRRDKAMQRMAACIWRV
jgi:YfiH family protein